ncbi:MAG: cytochrome c biogenesis protein CcsA [Myxococcales bacterium]|nr:cytochrome c biogenesis protein CcsA [Myxococcales bacterium]
MPDPAKKPSLGVFPVLVAATAVVFFWLISFVFFKTPIAQPEAGGLAQKIFYFHVPSAYAMYLSGVVCLVASGGYLLKLSDRWNAWAQAGAECAVVFGVIVLTSGPLWAKKAWGVYWVWDPRLTTSLLSVLIYVAVVVLRAFAGDGEAERKFAAALGVLGTVNLPIIHYSVRKWGGNHPTVITKGGGGLRHPDMQLALGVGFLAMTLLAVLLLAQRARQLTLAARLARAEERAVSLGLTEGS